MKIYEYLVRMPPSLTDNDSDKLEAWLGEFGANGWRLCAPMDGWFIFIRTVYIEPRSGP